MIIYKLLSSSSERSFRWVCALSCAVSLEKMHRICDIEQPHERVSLYSVNCLRQQTRRIVIFDEESDKKILY